MSGFFGAVSKEDCVFEVFYGTDYHSHLGTRRAGMVVYNPESGFDKSIHNIENSPFRTKFTPESTTMHTPRSMQANRWQSTIRNQALSSIRALP